MARIPVKLLYKGSTFDAVVDTSSDPGSVAQSLAKGLKLAGDAEYRLALVDMSIVSTGSTLELLELEMGPPGEIVGA